MSSEQPADTPSASEPPPGPPRANRTVETWLIAALVLLVAIGAAVVVIDRGTTPNTGAFTPFDDDPGALFEEAEAVEAAYTLRSADGVESTGWLAVTDDGYAENTLTDTGSGSATIRSAPDGEAVWGDSSWWGRRAPAQAAALAEQWVRPDEDIAFPVDVGGELNPDALGALIRSIEEEGEPIAEITSYYGIPAVASTHRDWTLIRTDTAPSEVLLLEGPIHSGLLHSAALDTAPPSAAPAAAEPDRHRPYGSLSGAESISIQPAPLDRTGAEVVRSTAGDTVSGKNTAPPAQEPDAAEEEAPDEPAPPPAQSELQTGQPSFEATIDASYCDTPTCTWSVSVTNTGTAAGEAVVEVSATPGMSPQTHDLGVIEPGSSASTPTLSMANPAPTPAPGQTTSVTVDYAAVVYSRELHGPDEDQYRRVAGRLGDGYRYWLDLIMGAVDAALKPAVLDSIERMLEEEVDPETALATTDWATGADPSIGDYSPLPVQSALAEYGDRFKGWSAIADHQERFSADDYRIFQAGLDHALNELADPAEPVVTYIPRTGADGRITAVEVISDHGSPETSRCALIVGDGGRNAGEALTAALDSLDGEASTAFAEQVEAGCPVSISIVADQNTDILSSEPESPNALLDGTALGERLRSGLRDDDRCAGSEPPVGQVTVQNRVGRSTWTGDELCGTATASIPQEQIDLLNELLHGTELLDQLVDRGAVTLDADGRVADVVWRQESEECSDALRTPEYAPTGDPKAPSNSTTRLSGQQAQGAWVYLCGSAFPGGTPPKKSIKPWDWPKSNPKRVMEGQRSRCHLIANMMGGSGDEVANLVTCFQGANNEPYMKRIETIVKRLAGSQDIFYLVTPQYNGTNGGLSGIRIVALGNKGLKLDVCVKNTVLGGFAFNRPC